ncbi:MAG: flagellar basal-body MS-ring/collar protein FliF [Syntrophomonadaceae bacterium]
MADFMERLKGWGNTILEAWNKLSLNQKVLFAGAALLVVAAIVILSSGTATNYEVLYSGLDAKTASQITTKLDEYKIGYQVQDGQDGTIILVPSPQKSSTRLKLAGDNLPQSESGFELFQTTNFGETESDKKVKYQMALQGELARTIQGLDKVKAAKVNLAIPESTLFSEKEEKAKASVVVNIKNGQTLTPKEVQAIVNLIANSVNGLSKENVAIVDQNGTLLSDNLPAEEMGSTEQVQKQMLMKKEFEREKQQAIQSMLDKTLGPDNAVVRVNAELNFNTKQEKSERYYNDEDGAHVRSESTAKESGITAPGPSGTPGTDTNVPTYTETTTGGASSTDKSSKTTNYEVSKTETDTKYAQGDVKYDHFTISVIVNNKAIKDVNLGATDAEKTDKIRGMVATACGLIENSQGEKIALKDSISVAFMDFVPEAEPETASSMEWLNKILDSKLLPLFMVLLALTVIAIVWLLSKKKAAKEVEEESVPFEAEIDEELRIEDIFDMSLTPEEREKQKIKEEIDKLVDSEPESAAHVLKSWLSED